MDIFLGLLLGLIIGGGAAWVVASSNSKSSIERTIRDLDGKAKGAEASRDTAYSILKCIMSEDIL